MKLGFSFEHFQSQLDMPIRRVLRAEELGFDSVWTSESYGTDAITPLAYFAALTKRIRFGTAVAQLAARPPASLAMCAQTIDALAGGNRLTIGLGTSGPQIVEGWYGQPWGKPNHQLRDYVAILKKVWKREGPVSHEGKEITLPYRGPGAIGLGKPLKSIMHGNPDIPVFLGTATPTNVRMTGEIADGWIGMHLAPATVKQEVALIEEGLARRTDGRTRTDFTLCGTMRVRIASDVRAAIDAFKPHVALYVGGMGAKEKNFHKDSLVRRGYTEAAERIQELFLAGHREEAAAAVPDDYLDDENLIGPPERIRERWNPWLQSGLDTMIFLGADDEAIELLGRLPRE